MAGESRPQRRAGQRIEMRQTAKVAHLSQIARNGATWFRRSGSPEEPGTALVTVSGAVAEVNFAKALKGTCCPPGEST